MSNKEILRDYHDMPSFHSIPQLAQKEILACVYQQGKAEAMKYAFDEMMKKIGVR